MKLLCITDLHGDEAVLEQILAQAGPADAILLGGDLTNFGTPDEAERLVRRAQQTGWPVLAVAGNCDSKAIDDRLDTLGVSLYGRGVQLGEVGFYGVSAMPPWTGAMYELTEEEIARALQRGRNQLGPVEHEVLLSHPPPRDCRLDRARGGRHVGSAAVRQLVDAVQPALVVCGHIHEARGIDQIGPTTVVNCGAAFRGHYAVANVKGAVEVALRRA